MADFLATETSLVQTSLCGSTLQIKLNRPAAINSLNLEMVKELWRLLKNIEHDKKIAVIVMTGQGEKGFCAGGDVKSVCLLTNTHESSETSTTYAEEFFKYEYLVDELLSRLSKPVICFGQGITMGGGLGLFMGASYRLAFESSLFAMPEVAIGFFPDVGAFYFLKKIWKPSFGKLAALSGARLSGADALFVNCATHFVRDQDSDHILQEIKTQAWSEDSGQNHALLRKALQSFAKQPLSSLADIESLVTKITEQSQLSEALSLWQTNSDKSEWLAEAWQSFTKGSPLSQQFIWKLWSQANWSRTEAAIRDWEIALRFCESSDFHEGVRAMLIDKDKSPHWQDSSVAEVSQQQIDQLLKPLSNNPLKAIFQR